MQQQQYLSYSSSYSNRASRRGYSRHADFVDLFIRRLLSSPALHLPRVLLAQLRKTDAV